MGSFGENLRREREMRGVTLEEISSATKISVRFLQAIENEEFSKLPGGIFGRSFIRAYIRYLGLEEEPLMAELQSVAPLATDVDLRRISVSKRSSAEEKSRAPFIALVLAAVMLAGGYALFRYSRRLPEPPRRVPTAPATATQAPSPASPASGETSAAGTLPIEQHPPTGVSAELSGPSPTAPAPVPHFLPSLDPEGGLVLQVAATERSWVAVEADGKMVLQRVLDPNEVENIRAKEAFDVTAGNAQGIVLTLNGETLSPLGRRGEVKKVRLTRADLKGTAR